MEERQKLKIGVDIDDTLVDFITSYLKFYEQKFGKKFDLSEIKDIYLREPFGHSCEEVKTLLSEYHQTLFFKNVSFLFGAKEILKEIFGLAKVFFITSRRIENEEITKKFLKDNFVEGNYELYFSGDIYEGRKLKEQICEELDLDLMVEDNPYFSENCARKGIKVLLLDKPWNKNCQHENIFRVNSWEEVLNEIKKLN